MGNTRVVLLLVIVAFLYTNTADGLSIANGKVRAFNSTEKLENEFIAVLNKIHLTDTTVAKEFVGYISRHHLTVVVHQVFVIRDFIAVHLTIPRPTDLVDIASNQFVKFIEPNFKISPSSCKIQGTGASLWGLSRISSHRMPPYKTATYTWEENDGSDVDSYVMDTGVRITHRDLQRRAMHLYTVDDIYKDEGDDDHNGHGTHVAGTIGGGECGVAKNTRIYSVKVENKEGEGRSSWFLDGLEETYANYMSKKSRNPNNKAVVNMSLGFAAPGPEPTSLEIAIIAAMAEGLNFVISAGNDATDACTKIPARVAGVITVAASQVDDKLTEFSNYGRCVDVIAPGKTILSAGIQSDTDYVYASGTSTAAPHVAGVVARYLSQAGTPVPSPTQVRDWVQHTATKDVIDLRGHSSTPNNLLYMNC